MIQTIFFDFGNVVAFFDHGRAVAEFARHTDMDPVELALALYGSPIADDYECGTLATDDYVRAALQNGRLACSADEFLAHYTNIFWPNPDVAAMIPRLKPRYRLVLGSNTNEAHYLRFTRDFADTLAHFDYLVTSHRAGARKPHPEFFAHALRFAEADPHECVFIDDLPVNVDAARRAGLHGIVYTPDGTLPGLLRAAGVEIGEPGR